jgi:hypothetical protein
MKIILPHDHDHAGVKHYAGEEFDFTEEQYAWFIQATNIIRSGDRKRVENTPGTLEWGKALLESEKAQEMGLIDLVDDEDDNADHS